MRQTKRKIFDRILDTSNPTFDNPSTTNEIQAVGIRTKKVDRPTISDAVNHLRRRGFGDSKPRRHDVEGGVGGAGGAAFLMHDDVFGTVEDEADGMVRVNDSEDDATIASIHGYAVDTSDVYPDDTVLLVDYDAVTKGGKVLQPAGVVVIGIEADGGSDE